MKRQFEYQSETSHKFWTIERDGLTVIVTYGRVGSDPRRKEKLFGTEESAQQGMEERIKNKLKKGYVEQTSPTVQSPAQIAAELGLEGLIVEIDSAEIESMTTSETTVAFPDALRSALTSYLEDGTLSESPLWIMRELPLDYELPQDADLAAAQAKIRELLNTSGCKLTLFTEPQDPNDAWVGVAHCDETGDIYGTGDNWIFRLARSPFTDLNYAVVDKRGLRPTVNWGFS